MTPQSNILSGAKYSNACQCFLVFPVLSYQKGMMSNLLLKHSAMTCSRFEYWPRRHTVYDIYSQRVPEFVHIFSSFETPTRWMFFQTSGHPCSQKNGKGSKKQSLLSLSAQWSCTCTNFWKRPFAATQRSFSSTAEVEVCTMHLLAPAQYQTVYFRVMLACGFRATCFLCQRVKLPGCSRLCLTP